MRRWTSAYAALLALALLIEAPPLGALDLGEGPVLLVADEVVYDAETNVVSAVGNVEVIRGERRLLADMLRYDQDTDRMEAEGNVALVEPTGETLPSERPTTSFGLLNRRPSNESASTVVSPCGFTRRMRRLPCWHITRRPSGSKVSPFEPGWR